MAQKFLTGIQAYAGIEAYAGVDLKKTELKNAAIQNLAAAPSSPNAGQIYFDTIEKEVKVWDGTNWIGFQDNNYVFSDGSNTFTLSETTNFVFNAGFGIQQTLNAPGDGTLSTSVNADLTNDFQFGAGNDLQLKDIIVAGGTVGSSTEIPVISYDTKGRITSISTSSISTDLDIAGDTGTDTISLATETLTFNGGDGISTDVDVTGVFFNVDNTVVRTSGAQTIGGDKTFSDNVVISGNLTVSGFTTTVNTETILLADNIITLNSNATGSATENAGIEVERGDDPNAELRWNETTDKWQIEVDPATDEYENIATEDYVATQISNNSFSVKISGDGLTSSFPILHSLNTKNVIVQLVDEITSETVYADVVRTSTSVITVSFASAPAIGEDYQVLMIKA